MRLCHLGIGGVQAWQRLRGRRDLGVQCRKQGGALLLCPSTG